MSVYLIQEAFDYNSALRMLRALMQDHPQLQKLGTPFDPADTGFTYGGGNTGTGVAYVAAGANMATVPFRLTCTLGGGDGVATFDVIEDFGGTNTNRGTLTAGQRFFFTDSGEVNEIIVRTVTNWAVADTIDFTMVAGTLGAEAWTENRFTEGAPDGNGDFQIEWVSSGPSIAGGDSIDIGWRTEFDFASQRYNWQLEGADGFVGGSSFGGQPNGSPITYLTLNDQPMPCWFVGTGDYMTGFIRPAPGIYVAFFAGFIEVFGTTGNHPKPIMVGCNAHQGTFNRNETDQGMSNFWDTQEQSAGGEGDGLGAMYLRWVDGLWLNFRNRNTTTTVNSGNGKQFDKSAWTSPYVEQENDFQLGSLPNALGYGWNEHSRRLVPRSSGRYNLRPIECFITSPQSALVGQIPAWKYIPGFAINPEDTVVDNSPVFNGTVVQNITRTARDSFAVLQLDP